MPKSETKSLWLNFSLNISFVVLLFILAIFLGLFIRNRQLLEGELLTRARSYFASLLLTRHWNAQYGGVYVEKTEGMESNPYLLNPDITSTDGRVFTKKNPALMTRELSELAKGENELHFRITSLKPLNPANAPDQFEEMALKAFAEGKSEYVRREIDNGSTHYRYMAPLITENACLSCHGHQGYQVGDVRGGISVSFDVSKVEQAMHTNLIAIVLLFVATAALLLGIIYSFIFKLHQRLTAAQKQLALMAITDELSGLHNRRHFFAKLAEECQRGRRYKKPLSCLLLDIDHFKEVNDSHGHPVGDAVIRAIGLLLRAHSRQTDIAARYGGEEFALLLPETGREEALLVAEKLRRAIAAQEIAATPELHLQVSASFGVSSWSEAELTTREKAADLVKECDDALYRAKKGGRNQVACA